MNIPKKVEVKYHYDKDDENCSGDFYSADVWFDGKSVFELTDEYHDNTSRQIQGFLFACKIIWGGKFPKVKVSQKNDAEI